MTVDWLPRERQSATGFVSAVPESCREDVLCLVTSKHVTVSQFVFHLLLP
jgi:hypothetical protein